jgi:Zn-dependent membrane protease YugP
LTVYWFNFEYMLFIAPALLLMLWAQMRVKSTYAAAMRVDARLSGAAAARHLLDEAGCQNVNIEETDGFLSDHYDPRHRVLRLSHDVYHSRSAAAVGIAAHEAGHALQHAHGYAPLAIRNFAVPAAMVGPWVSIVLLMIGVAINSIQLIWLGILAYAGILIFQLVNLPVEFDASKRAKTMLTEYHIVDGEGAAAVRQVLNAAGWTYVAATLQTLLTLLYYVLHFAGGRSRN